MFQIKNASQNETGKDRKITNENQTKKSSLRLIFWVSAILLGIIQAWAHRYEIFSEDGISYLDIADAYLRGDWQAALNGNWSPLYSWLIGLAVSILHPSSYWEFPTLKLINFLIYLFALFSFEFFLSELCYQYQIKILQNSGKRKPIIPEWGWVVWGYILFIWSSLRWIGVECDTPDMCTAGLIYLAVGIVLRLSTKSDSWLDFIMLGLVLGLGYLSKAIMFPLAFIFLIVGMFSSGNFRKVIPKTLAALIIFSLIVTPFITAISIQKGHFTIGEAGKLSYAWYISPKVDDHYWQGSHADKNTAKHLPRKIFNTPPVYEFGTPLSGTYPIWYDPSYWNDGLKPKFNLRRQIQVVASNLIYYYNLFLGGLIFGYLILVSFGGRFWLSIKELAESWRLLIPAIAGLTIYLLVTDLQYLQPLETRYIAPFVVLFFIGTLASIRLPSSQEAKRLISGMTVSILIVLGIKFCSGLVEDLSRVVHQPPHINWLVAEELKQLGIESGDPIAHLGFKGYDWARLARVKIVAEIPSITKFWYQDAATQSAIIKAIEKTGAKAIVQHPKYDIPNKSSAIGWKKLSNTKTYVYLLGKSES